MLHGLSVSSMQGYAAPDVQSDHRRAEALATRLGTRPEVLPSLIAIWAYWLTSGDLSTARGLIDRLSDMVRQPAFSWFEPEVESCAGWLDFYQGDLDSARAHLERGTAGFLARPADQMVSPFWPLPNDPIAVSEIALACVSTLQGEPDEAQRWEREAVARAEAIGFPHGPFSLAFVKTYAAWIRRFLGQHDASRLLGSEVVGIGQAYGYAYWMMLGSLYVTTADPVGEPNREFLEQSIATLRLMARRPSQPPAWPISLISMQRTTSSTVPMSSSRRRSRWCTRLGRTSISRNFFACGPCTHWPGEATRRRRPPT